MVCRRRGGSGNGCRCRFVRVKHIQRNPQLTVIIVNWRTPDLTVRAVRALAEDGVDRADVIIVDNASDDGSVEVIAAEGVEVLALAENVGFARANNEAARRRPADDYLLVNSDAFVDAPGSVSNMRARLAGTNAGIVVPRLLNADRTLQPSVAPLPSPAVALVQASGLSRFLPDALQPSFGTHWQHNEERGIQAANGAVMLVSGELWEKIGGFDESTFMYAEDRDFCWRARKAGWDVWFTPVASFVHLGNASAGGRWWATERAERVGAAEAAMMRRHLGRRTGALTVAIIRMGLALRVATSRLFGKAAAAERFSGSLRGFSAVTRHPQDGDPAKRKG